MQQQQHQDLDAISTVDEAAEYLKLHRVTILRMLNRSELKGFKLGRVWRITRTTLEKIQNRGGKKHGARS